MREQLIVRKGTDANKQNTQSNVALKHTLKERKSLY